ncbi:MAG TPA: TonB-dependent receptor [Longimicrobium sp.]
MSGRVLDPRQSPISGAIVELTVAEDTVGGRELRAVSGADGRYELSLPAAGGEYVLAASRMGFVSATLLVSHPAGVRSLTQDISLTPLSSEAVALPEVVARAARRVPTPPAQERAPGENATTNLAFSNELFPIEAGDLLASAALAPGVLPSGGESGRGVSIGGQPASQNRTTLDGAGYGSSSVPAEAVAASGVITHPYDVSRGQFTGGEIAATTRSGTNLWGGSLSVAVVDPRLQFDGDAAGSMGDKYSVRKLSAGGGGPIVPGRLFVYGAAEVSSRDASPGVLGGSSFVAADSLERLSAVLSGLGLETRPPVASLQNTSSSGIARFDYLPGTRHAFMARVDGRDNRTSGIGASPFAFARSAELRTSGAGALLQAISRYGAVQNQFRVYGSAGSTEVNAGSPGPSGSVRVGAGTPLGQASSVSFRFGGSSLGGTSSERSSLEAGDRLVVSAGDGAHLLQVGATYTAEEVSSTGGANRSGSFTFASLEELAAGRAISFTRSLTDTRREAATRNAALFAGDTWKVRDDFSIVMGVRGERRWYPPRHGGDAVADSLFGLRTGRIAPEWGVSPRAGFRYRHSPFVSLHGGVGEFRGSPPLLSLGSLLGQTGRDGAGRELVCVGSAVPGADWSSYSVDPSTIPEVCADGSGLFSTRAPTIAAFSAGYSAPRVRRASLDATWGSEKVYLAADASFAWGTGGALATDANLDGAPKFRLANEGGRPVYVSGGAIDPGTGSLTLQDSRRHAGYGIVRQVSSRGRTRTGQFVLDGTWQLRKGYVAGSYAYTRSEDQASGFSAPGGALSSTAGDPSRAEWGPRDYEQRHAASLRASSYFRPRLQFTLVGYLLSGAPFSPMVDGDISGDGVANDRAFVFDSASSPELAREMGELIGRVPGSIRSCLLRQTGRVAARNSCRTPWTASLDAQMNVLPLGTRDRRLSINITAQNVIGGLDYLLNGSEPRGWGPGRFDYPDPVLLRVRGFDPAAQRFRYEVNPQFGSPAGETGEGRVPFTLRIQARISLGSDPSRQPLSRLMVSMDASRRPAELRTHFSAHLRNVPALVLAAADSLRLGLTEAQTSELRRAADSLAVHIEAATEALAIALSQPRSASPRERNTDQLLADARALLESGAATTRSILTPAQWSRLPRRTVRVPRRIPRPTVGVPSPF